MTSTLGQELVVSNGRLMLEKNCTLMILVTIRMTIGKVTSIQETMVGPDPPSYKGAAMLGVGSNLQLFFEIDILEAICNPGNI